MSDNRFVPTYSRMIHARELIAGKVHRTPVMTCGYVDRITGGTCCFKLENFQKTGSFKARGAAYAVGSLSEAEAARGSATHSSGNHAQALAYASAVRGIPAHIVMPENASRVKIDAVKGYGGVISFCGPTLADREAELSRVISRTGAAFIHPYDDGRIIAAQGSCAAEFLEQTEHLDMVIAPVGGGGLLSGTSLWAYYQGGETAVFGAEPAGADDARRSFVSGALAGNIRPDTIADGLRTQLSELTFSVIRRYAADIVLVTDEQIAEAMRLIWERMKVVIEPSAAVPVAAVLSGSIPCRNKRIGIILSGGNVDVSALPWSGG